VAFVKQGRPGWPRHGTEPGAIQHFDARSQFGSDRSRPLSHCLPDLPA